MLPASFYFHPLLPFELSDRIHQFSSHCQHLTLSGFEKVSFQKALNRISEQVHPVQLSSCLVVSIMVSASSEQRFGEVVKLVPSSPTLDGLPMEIFREITTLAIDTAVGASEYCTLFINSKQTRKKTKKFLVITDNVTLMACLLVNKKFRSAVEARKEMLSNKRRLQFSSISSSKAIKDFNRTRQPAPGAMNLQKLGIEAHLLPYFIPKRSLARATTTVGHAMFPNLECLTVFLRYNDEGHFTQRDDTLEIEYVYKAVERMLDGVRTQAEDFVFGFQTYKNILQIEYSYKGKVVSASLFPLITSATY